MDWSKIEVSRTSVEPHFPAIGFNKKASWAAETKTRVPVCVGNIKGIQGLSLRKIDDFINIFKEIGDSNLPIGQKIDLLRCATAVDHDLIEHVVRTMTTQFWLSYHSPTLVWIDDMESVIDKYRRKARFPLKNSRSVKIRRTIAEYTWYMEWIDSLVYWKAPAGEGHSLKSHFNGISVIDLMEYLGMLYQAEALERALLTIGVDKDTCRREAEDLWWDVPDVYSNLARWGAMKKVAHELASVYDYSKPYLVAILDLSLWYPRARRVGGGKFDMDQLHPIMRLVDILNIMNRRLVRFKDGPSAVELIERICIIQGYESPSTILQELPELTSWHPWIRHRLREPESPYNLLEERHTKFWADHVPLVILNFEDQTVIEGLPSEGYRVESRDVAIYYFDSFLRYYLIKQLISNEEAICPFFSQELFMTGRCSRCPFEHARSPARCKFPPTLKNADCPFHDVASELRLDEVDR